MSGEHGRLFAARLAAALSLPTTRFQQMMLGVTVSVTVLCFLTFLLRVYSRRLTKQFGLDDYLVGFATALAVAGMGPTYVFCKYAFVGFPATDPNRLNKDTSAVNYWSYVIQLTYNPVLAIVKSSVLILLLRIGGHRRGVRWTIYILNTINFMLMIAICLVATFQTLPIQALWDPNVAVTHSIDSGDFGTATSALTVFGDLLVLCIPLWLFTGLQMRLAVKAGLIAVFLLSGLVTAVGIIRMVLFRIAWSHPDRLDYWDTWGPVLGQIESALAIITACIPTMKPVLAAWMPSLFASETSAKYGSQNFIASRTFGGATFQSQRPSGARQGHTSVVTNSFVLQSMGHTHTVIRDHSPHGSEEEMMTSNGIVRRTEIKVSYDMETLSAKESSDDLPVHAI